MRWYGVGVVVVAVGGCGGWLQWYQMWWYGIGFVVVAMVGAWDSGGAVVVTALQC